MTEPKEYIITETGMNLAIAVLKVNHLYDTAASVLEEIRPHTPAQQAQQRIDTLDLLKKKVTWGKEIDRNHLFDYQSIGKMIEEAEQRALLQDGAK